jgi:hypothetical protein
MPKKVVLSLTLFTMRLPGDLWFNQMLLLAWLAEEDGEDGNEWFYNQLNGKGCRRRDCHLPRPTLLLPSMETTPWKKLYAAHHDPALITVTGLDYDSFAKLLSLFGPYYNEFTPWTLDGQIYPKSDPGFRGWKCIMDDATCLALALTYTGTRGSLFMLQAFFGLTATPLVTWMQYRKRIIIKILQNLDDVRIKMPTTNNLFEYSTIIKRAYPVLSGHYAVCDELKRFIKKAGIVSIQGT